MAFIFLDEIWWVLGTVVFLLSRRGRWPKHFILRLPRCIVVKACLNCRAGIEIKEMLKENTSVLWPWGSAAAVSAAVLSVKGLETGQKRKARCRLQRIQRGGAEHEHHFLFLISIKRRENHSWFQSPRPQPGRGPVCSVFFAAWHVCGLDLVLQNVFVRSGESGGLITQCKADGKRNAKPCGCLQKCVHLEGESAAGMWELLQPSWWAWSCSAGVCWVLGCTQQMQLLPPTRGNHLWVVLCPEPQGQALGKRVNIYSFLVYGSKGPYEDTACFHS